MTADSTPKARDNWVTRTSNVCPDCHSRGAAQGIQGVGKWMQCSNGHEWGYEDVR